MRRGIRLAVDPGDARIGLARSDPDGMLATPEGTLARDVHSAQEIATRVSSLDCLEVVIGLPLSLSGAWTSSTRKAIEFAREIAALTPCSVIMVDERLTTNSAKHALREVGRSERQGRSVIDQIAAVTLLQHVLDTERQSGKPPGVTLDQIREPS